MVMLSFAMAAGCLSTILVVFKYLLAEKSLNLCLIVKVFFLPQACQTISHFDAEAFHSKLLRPFIKEQQQKKIMSAHRHFNFCASMVSIVSPSLE